MKQRKRRDWEDGQWEQDYNRTLRHLDDTLVDTPKAVKVYKPPRDWDWLGRVGLVLAWPTAIGAVGFGFVAMNRWVWFPLTNETGSTAEGLHIAGVIVTAIGIGALVGAVVGIVKVLDFIING